MVNAFDLRVPGQPFGHLQAAFMVLTQAHSQRTDTAAGHVGRIRIHHLAHQVGILPKLIPAARVGYRSTDHAIRVANQIFGRCLNRDINVEFQRPEQHARRPGVVDHDDCLGGFAAHCFHNSRDVVHFHGDRAWGFQKHNARVRLDKFSDTFANQRIEPAGGHAELAEDFGAKILAWFISGIGHQDMVALFHKRQNGIGNCRRTTGEQGAAHAAFQFAHGFLK